MGRMTPDSAPVDAASLQARVEVLTLAVSLLISRLSEDDLVSVGGELMAHFAQRRESAIASSLPDSFVSEVGAFADALLLDAAKLARDRLDGDDG